MFGNNLGVHWNIKKSDVRRAWRLNRIDRDPVSNQWTFLHNADSKAQQADVKGPHAYSRSNSHVDVKHQLVDVKVQHSNHTSLWDVGATLLGLMIRSVSSEVSELRRPPLIIRRQHLNMPPPESFQLMQARAIEAYGRPESMRSALSHGLESFMEEQRLRSVASHLTRYSPQESRRAAVKLWMTEHKVAIPAPVHAPAGAAATATEPKECNLCCETYRDDLSRVSWNLCCQAISCEKCMETVLCSGASKCPFCRFEYKV